jgi:hypothetical protein
MARNIARVTLVAGLVAVVASCTPPAERATAMPSLDRQISGDMAAKAALAWSADRRLSWSDFEAAAPRAGDEGALTAYSIFYGVRCTGEAFGFLAVAGFLPHESWVRADVTSDRVKSERTLRHEQTHFDLTEVFTRRLRKSFAAMYEPCRRPDQDLAGLAAQYLHSEQTEQQRYDDETRHGLAAPAQDTWDRRVAEDLNSLRAFGR